MLIFSLFKQFLNSIKKICLEIFVPNRRIRRILKGDIAQNYLKKYVKKVIKENKNQNSEFKEIENYTIWQFWDKGIENAPEIVKKCVESIDKFEPDKRHIILNMDNIKEYVEIPKIYYDLLNAKKIKTAHFADILRTCLLIKYGGCWIDSTVLLTDKLPKYIINSDFFVFKNYKKADLDGLNMANYFIHSKPNNKVLKDLLEVMKKYWKDNNFVVNYFFYLHTFTLLTESDKKDKEIYDKIPFSSFIPVQHLQNELMNKFDEKKWEACKTTTPIHKLSFKKDVLGLGKEKNFENTYYEKLLKGELN